MKKSIKKLLQNKNKQLKMLSAFIENGV